MFPDTHHLPPIGPQELGIRPVALHIPGDLWNPVFCVRFRTQRAFAATVPKATVYEDSDVKTGKHKVSAATELALSTPTLYSGSAHQPNQPKLA